MFSSAIRSNTEARLPGRSGSKTAITSVWLTVKPLFLQNAIGFVGIIYDQAQDAEIRGISN